MATSLAVCMLMHVNVGGWCFAGLFMAKQNTQHFTAPPSQSYVCVLSLLNQHENIECFLDKQYKIIFFF